MTKEERYLEKLEKFDNQTNAVRNHTDFKELPGVNWKKVMESKLYPRAILEKQVTCN